MNPAIDLLCKKLFPHELDARALAEQPRRTGFATAGGWDEDVLQDAEAAALDAAALTDGIYYGDATAGLAAAALTEASGHWDVTHYREFPIPGAPATAMVEESRGGSCRLTIVSEDSSLHEARVEFDLSGWRGSLTLVDVNGICTGHRDLEIAWASLDLTSPRFHLIHPTQPG